MTSVWKQTSDFNRKNHFTPQYPAVNGKKFRKYGKKIDIYIYFLLKLV